MGPEAPDNINNEKPKKKAAIAPKEESVSEGDHMEFKVSEQKEAKIEKGERPKKKYIIAKDESKSKVTPKQKVISEDWDEPNVAGKEDNKKTKKKHSIASKEESKSKSKSK